MDLVEYLSTWHLKNYEKTTIEPDRQVPLSFSMHSKDAEIYYHLQLKPMYSYSRLYLGGAELEKHTDRKACEISASITLKYFYHNKEYQWPLCMGNTPINIKPGDGVIYKGEEIEHWRPVFQQAKECWHHQVFVHYVDLNGHYADEKEEVNL